MSKKWSQKTEKLSVVAADEFMILDSEDANNATKNKRVKASTLINGGPNTFTFQTVGAVSQQQTFICNAALTVRVQIAAANVGNTKGLAADIVVTCSLTQNTTALNVSNDFGTANINLATAPNLVTVTMNGEAGETIDWKGSFQVVSN